MTIEFFHANLVIVSRYQFDAGTVGGSSQIFKHLRIV
jgi:hypothetical protein